MSMKTLGRKKVVKLSSYTIKNFKGIKDLTIKLDGDNAIVKGANGTGKTTLYDAVLWALFEKDSQGKTDFAIKPIDGDGNEIHHLETSVEVTLLVDGLERKFKRALKEKWVSRPGEIEKVYGGNDTQWYVDGLKVRTKKAYNEAVAEIVNEDVFRYITSITHFLAQNPKVQRELLTVVAGEVSKEELLSQNPTFEKVESILGEQEIHHVMQVKVQNISESKKRADLIPSLIEENYNQLREVDATAATKKGELEKEIDNLKEQMLNVKNGEALRKTKNAIEDKQKEMLALESDADNAEVNKLNVKSQECESNIAIQASKVDATKRMIADAENNLHRYKQGVEKIKSQQAELRVKWREVNAKQAEIEVDTSCPTCKQSLPQESVERVKQEALEQFHLKKSGELETIKNDGIALKERVTDGEKFVSESIENIESLTKRLEQEELELIEHKKEYATTLEKLEKAKNDVVDVKETDAYKALEVRLKELENERDVIQESVAYYVNELQQGIDALQSKLTEVNELLSVESSNASIKKRITELQVELSALGDKIVVEELDLQLLKDYQNAEIKQVEVNVNNLFTMTKFKMFETQVNGGVKNICQATHNGVSVGKGLNTAATINVGLDIINVLSNHYGVTAPVFIDNAESVTNFIDTDAQLIKMYVVPEQKLIVEKEGN